MIIPTYSALLSNLLAIFIPNSTPKKVKVALTIANIKQATSIFLVVNDKAIPTEKLSMLTVKEKIIIEIIFVIVPPFLSFLEKNISNAKMIKIIPTK